MQKYVDDLRRKLHSCLDFDYIDRFPDKVVTVIRDAINALGMLDAARRKLVEEKILLRNELRSSPSWTICKQMLPKVSGDYVVLIYNAEVPTTLYFDSADETFYDEYNTPYVVSYWLDNLKHPEVSDDR